MIACSLHAHHAAERQSSTIWVLEVNYASQKPYIRQEMFWNLFLIVKKMITKIIEAKNCQDIITLSPQKSFLKKLGLSCVKLRQSQAGQQARLALQ